MSKPKIGGYRAGSVPNNATYRKVAKKQSLPPKVDLRNFLTSIEYQVGNSCVANAFAGAYEYLAKRTLGESGDVSRLFIYYNARSVEGMESEDEGTTMTAAIEALKEYGACSEDYWANDEEMILEEPDEDSYSQASSFKVVEEEYLETDLELWKQTLAQGYPIAFALNTFNSFDSATTNKGRVPLPRTRETERETHGWHAMLCVGYSDPDQRFIVRNSWGEEWGDSGYCYIPYDYIIHQNLNAHDSWIIKAVENLDFSEDIASDDEESYFAEEGLTYLEDFWVELESSDDVEDFASALEELCLEYVESEEDFYFEYEETEEDDCIYIEMSSFEILTEDYESFLEALDELCLEYAIDENYSYEVTE